MAQMMDLGRLCKMGYEAFAFDARKGRPNSPPARQPPAVSRQASKVDCVYPYQPQKPLVYQVNPASAAEEVMNYDAMMMHDGLQVLDYSKKISTAMAY